LSVASTGGKLKLRASASPASFSRSNAYSFNALILFQANRRNALLSTAHLADSAEKDRNALLCQLNSYLGSKEGAA
jgi:hypothetical protein